MKRASAQVATPTIPDDSQPKDNTYTASATVANTVDDPPTLSDISNIDSAQRKDSTLQNSWTQAENPESDFIVDREVLFRITKDQLDNDCKQIPTHRQEITGNSSGPFYSMAGHLACKKTYDRFSKRFFLPGVHRDVKEACTSCGGCQKATRKNQHKAPLIPLPVMRES